MSLSGVCTYEEGITIMEDIIHKCLDNNISKVLFDCYHLEKIFSSAEAEKFIGFIKEKLPPSITLAIVERFPAVFKDEHPASHISIFSDHTPALAWLLGKNQPGGSSALK